jgi:hypothetical protein
MEVTLTFDDFTPLVERIVERVIERLDERHARVHGQLAFTLPQAAAALGLRQHVLDDARRRGEIHAVKLGKRFLYPRAELLRFLGERDAR